MKKIIVIYWDIDGDWNKLEDLEVQEFDCGIDYQEWLHYSVGIKLHEVRYENV